MALALFGSMFPDSTSRDSLPPADLVESVDELQDDAGGAVLLDDLQWRHDHPYDLNAVSFEALLSIPSVTEEEATAVIRFREEKGGFQSVLQLLTMEGGGTHAYGAISPYVVVGYGRKGRGAVSGLSARSRLTGRVPADSTLFGSPWRSYNRVWVSPVPAVESGVLLERDAGELTRDAFTSAYLSVFNAFSRVDLTIGDFSVESGQGLVLWRGNVIGKSAWAVTGPRKSARGIVPHRSSGETNFFRGCGVTGRWPAAGGRLEWTAFASTRHGGPDGSSHVPVSVTGGRLLFTSSEKLSLGVTALRSFSREPTHSKDPMRFRGGRFDAAGADFRLSLQSLNLFGEGAFCSGRGTALAAGLSIAGEQEFSALIHFRNYAPQFDNPYAGGFGDNGETRNERGVYVGLVCAPLHGLILRMYYDQYVHPMPGGLRRFPTAANELLVEAEATLAPHASLNARYVVKNGTETHASRDEFGRETRGESEHVRERWRLTLSLTISRHVRFTTRLERTSVAMNTAGRVRGFMIYEDLQAGFPPISISARLVLFDCDAYDARIYEFESDLPGRFSSQVLYGRGRRIYVMARLSPARLCSLSLKAALLDKEPGISSGALPRELRALERIDIAAQVDFRI
ncbi:MAG: helix-hairpin-helix domain-containing protein [Bacteroidota bacterium]